MSMTSRWSGWLLMGALLAGGTAARAQETFLNLDEEYARLAEKVPGFGGLYVDAAGTTHVYLQDLSKAREVENLGKRVVTQQGAYDFRDLFTWKDDVRDLLAQKGAVFLDIDEKRNRLVFGVEKENLGTFTAELQKSLRRSRVPAEAVVVEAAAPFATSELLTDRMRPMPNGIQIQNDSGGICTLGVNAMRFGVKGFVTASHCTNTRSAVEGTSFFQAVQGVFNLVGTEIADPSFFVLGACPIGKLCRYSDAAFVDYLSDSNSAGGVIANPLSCSPVAGTLTVDPAFPRLPVTDFLFGSPAVGSFVTKVGRTTGCTFGPTTGTCVNSNVSGTNITMLCQNVVLAGSAGGDSGSPVFWDYGNEATLLGVLWGGNGSSFVYSPWLYVHGEIGGALLPDML